MGNYLKIIQNHYDIQPFLHSFLNKSLSKLREYYGIYKSLCDHYSIDSSQFDQIFQADQDIFTLFDSNNNLLVNALQLFSAIILFSQNSKFQDKIKFLFDIFDFNQFNSLSTLDIQFMIITCCCATNKVLGKVELVPQQQIKQFINQQFTQDSRINISQMIKWCSHVQQIKQYFQVIKKQLPKEHTLISKKIYMSYNPITREPTLKVPPQEKSFEEIYSFMNSKKHSHQKDTLHNLLKKLDSSQKKYSIPDPYYELNWVYGFRSEDVKKPFTYISLDHKQYVLYFTSSIVVTYELQSHKQKHYSQHLKQVISLAVHKKRRLVASGEFGQNPCLHLWQLQTNKPICQLSHTHKIGIHLLQFTKQNLFSSSISSSSVIQIHELTNYSLVLSTYVPSISLGFEKILYESREGVSEMQGVLVILQRGMQVVQKHGQWVMKRIYNEFSDITCGLCIPYSDNPYLLSYLQQQKKVIISGHLKGQVILWQIQQQRSQRILQYSSQIIDIKTFTHGYIIATDAALIDIYQLDILSPNKILSIDLTALPFKLFSYQITGIHLDQEKMFISSAAGDFVEIGFKYQAIWFNNSFIQKLPSKRYNTMLNLPLCSSLCLLNGSQQTIYIGGQSTIIYGFDLKSHEVVDMWSIGERISAMDCGILEEGETVFLVGTKSGRLIMRVDWQQSNRHYQCEDQIKSIKLSSNKQFMICLSSCLHLFTRPFLQNPPILLSLQSQMPIGFQYTQQQKSIIVTTQLKNLYIYQLVEPYKYRNILYQDTRWKCAFKSNNLIIRDDRVYQYQKYLYVYNSQTHVKRFTPTVLFGHCSPIASASLTNSLFLLSLGQNDHTLLQWKLKNTNGNFFQQFKYQKSHYQDINQIYQREDVLHREIEFAYFRDNIFDFPRDQFIMFRGTKDQRLRTLLKNQLPDIQQTDIIAKRPPTISIELDFVYGFQCFDKRNSVAYLHYRSSGVQKESNIYQIANRHYTCRRQILYFTSRIAIVYNPITNTQRFYQQHKFKITCFAVHPDMMTVITGESAARPSLHIWNSENMEVISVIKTSHKMGILEVIWSFDGKYLISLGFANTPQDKILSYSLIVSTCKKHVAYINLSQPVSLYSGHSYNTFYTISYQELTYWQFRGHTLQKKAIVIISQAIISAICKIGYNKGIDLILGDNMGKIGIVKDGHYHVMQKHAHHKIINCINVNSIHPTDVVIISAAQDQLIKIWSKKFTLIVEIDVRKIQLIKQIKNNNQDKDVKEVYVKSGSQKNVSAQSIDFYSCFQQMQQTQHPIILFATRCGQIIQAHIQFVQDQQNQELKQGSSDQIGIKFNFQFRLYLRNHCSQLSSPLNKPQVNKKVFYALHPSKPIMVTIGQDTNIFVWDIQKNLLLLAKPLGYTTPTAIKFSPEGDILVIGFMDGLLSFLDSKIIKSMHGKTEEKFQPPSLEVINQFRQQSKTPVLNIEFSSTGQHVAASYDQSSSSKDKFDSKLQNDCSFITVFVNKNKARSHKHSNEKYFYERFTDVRGQQSKHITTKSQYGIAAYFMTFSHQQDNSKNVYLLIYYQLVGQGQMRVNLPHDAQHIVWNINNNSDIKNLQQISHIQWKKYNFPNSLNARYIFYSDIIQLDKQTSQKEDTNKNLHQPAMSAMFFIQSKNVYVAGSMNGQIHFVKNASLGYSDGFNVSQIPQRQMCLSKTYSGHVSFVNQAQVWSFGAQKQFFSDDYLFTSGINDQTIMKWKIIYQNAQWQFDSCSSDTKLRDLYGFLQTENHFTYLQKQLLPIRQTISDIRNSAMPTKNSIKLKVKTIIGRRSFDRRNNLFYDEKGRIVYIAGCNIVIGKKEGDTIKQMVILAEQSQFACNAQISAAAMSVNQRFLAVGTCQLKSKVFIWCLSSKSCCKAITISNCMMIMNICFAYDNCHIAINGITHDYKSILMLIDTFKGTILGVSRFIHSPPWKIKELKFKPNSITKFLSCGVQHMTLWTYKGRNLCFQHYNLSIKQQYEGLKRQTQKQKLKQDQLQEQVSIVKTTFFQIAFVNQLMISCCQLGFIYLWIDKKIINRHKAHNAIITTMHSQNQRIVTGDQLGKIFLWQISQQTFQPLLFFDLSNQPKYSLKNQQDQSMFAIQSIYLRNGKILVGIKKGQVYQCLIPEQIKKKNQQNKKLVMSFYDNEIPISVGFSPKNQNIYILFSSGLLIQQDSLSLLTVQECNFKKTAKFMLICQKTLRIIIGFKREVEVINIQKKMEIKENYHMILNGQLADMQVSKNQKMLILAINPLQENGETRIEIYDAETQQNCFRSIMTGTVQNRIQLVDFSIDNTIAVYKDENKNYQLIDIQKSENINKLLLQHQIEWCGRGILATKQYGKYEKLYNDDLIGIKMMQDYCLAWDEVGLLRVWQWPQPVCRGIYCNHLNKINCVKWSLNLQKLISCSESDKCIIIWQMIS